MAHFQTPFLGSWNQIFFGDPVDQVIFFYYLSTHIGQSRRWGGGARDTPLAPGLKNIPCSDHKKIKQELVSL